MEMKTRYQFFLPLVNGNNGRRRCSIFHGDVIRIKAGGAAGWKRNVRFFSSFFFFPSFLPAYRIYVYIMNTFLPFHKRRNGVITAGTRRQPFIREISRVADI